MTVVFTLAYKSKTSPTHELTSLANGEDACCEFTTGPTLSEKAGYGGSLTVSDQGSGQSVRRQLCLSEVGPGDFTANTSGPHGDPTNYIDAMNPWLQFGDTSQPPSKQKPQGKPSYTFILKPNTKYYGNFRNVDQGSSGGGCLVTLHAA